MPTFRHLLMLVSVLPMLAVGSSPAFSQEIDVELKERFLREAPPAWKAYIEFASRFQLKISNNIKASIRLETPKQIQFEWKVSEHGALDITTDATAGIVGGTNRSYSFVLDRSGPNGEWVAKLVQFHKDQDRAAEAFVQMPRKHALLLNVSGLFLPDVIKEPDFTIKSIQPHNHNGEKLVKLAFENRKGRIPNQTPTHPRWVILDPKHDWTVREYEKGPLRWTHYIREDKDKHPIVERSTIESVSGTTREELTYQAYEQVLPESDFRLPAFGLPEPVADFMDPAGWKSPLDSSPKKLAELRMQRSKNSTEREPAESPDSKAGARSVESLWIVAAVAGLLGLVFGCKRLSRRPRRPDESTA